MRETLAGRRTVGDIPPDVGGGAQPDRWVQGCCLDEAFGGNRFAEKPALPHLATEQQQHLGLFLGFHALGDRRQAEALPETHDCGDDLAALPPCRHRANEAAVHLQFIEGQRLKMKQAGVACAEVVEGQTAPERLELR